MASFLLKIICFIGAFLLFQIELILAKLLLPIYGGSYLVWGACMVFFQATLLLGYLFVHGFLQQIGMARYRYLHLSLLCLPLLLFPGRPLPAIQLHSQISVVIDIFLQLAGCIGPVFFALSTISMTSQKWLAASVLAQHTNPYPIFAVSNLGSLGALLTYPFLFERFLTMPQQLNIWRSLYFLLVLASGLLLIVLKIRYEAPSREMLMTPFYGRRILSWLLLSAAGVVMFLSVTNIITMEVAPIPLFWIIPLSIYLLSFVLTFRAPGWYPVWLNERIALVLGTGILFYFFTITHALPFLITLLLLNVILFILCMFCQGELYRIRPLDPHQLTFFYVIISLGGFLGGMLVSWVVPLIFNNLAEYMIGLFLIALGLFISQNKIECNFRDFCQVVYFLFAVIVWPFVFPEYNLSSLCWLFGLFAGIFLPLRKNMFVVSLIIGATLVLLPILETLWIHQVPVEQKRNYYGLCKVNEKSGERMLIHGTTIHGMQALDETKSYVPLAYYAEGTAISEIMRSDKFNFQHIAVLGLGTGTLAAYLREGQVMDFFELDPDVYKIVGRHFTFAKNAQGKINYIFGDARLSLDKMPLRYYDLIVVDVFGGDAIPAHLLTTEAIAKYREHLSEKGMLVFNITNRFLDLIPVLASNARVLNTKVIWKKNEANAMTYKSTWAVLSWNAAIHDILTHELGWQESLSSKERPWTDEYSSVLGLMKF